MKRKLRILLAIGVVLPMILLSGCLFNIFQTAKMVQSGDMSVLIGSGLMDLGIEETPAWALTPQARLNFGLSNTVNLGLHTGAMIPLSSGEPGWMGVASDLKFSIIDNPESISLAVGFGGGYGIHFLTWGVFGEVYLDLNVFPLFFAYQPTIPLGGEGLVVWHDVAVGMALNLSETARLLIQVDTRNLALFSYGIAFEIAF
ncbi:hypothetical protein IH601_04865 [Candidatus Bipolaricaulota bacterium]|nr:hypothetical protein [Candidatus Bipolaricaulota bacterium]TFH07221.1 MAG: hypothetical protein E4H08_09850 [Candidatus Atribacteria bacterium]